MTDYRALCEQLMEFAEGRRYDGSAVIAKARFALAQPEPVAPVAPTDEELIDLFEKDYCHFHICSETFLDIARSVLELR
jgi:hypothetical protein